MKKKIVWIAHDIDRFVEFEWLLETLDQSKYEISVILIDTERRFFYHYLKENEIPLFQIPLDGKKNMARIFYGIYKILRKIRPEIVHAHFLFSELAGLSAAKLAGVKRRIYTRHRGNYHAKYTKRGVMFDYIANALSTDIIAISKNVQKILVEQEGVRPSKIKLIYHGHKMSEYENIPAVRVKGLKEKYNPAGNSPVVGVISRYMHLKGIFYLIDAYEEFLKKHPNALMILANTVGPDSKEVRARLEKLPQGSYKEVLFETDVFALYSLFDLFVHIPVDPEVEAFGQTYVEALASAVPSVFTPSGVAPEFIVHEENALLVPFKNPIAVLEAMNRIMEDENLKEKLIKNGKKSVIEKFDISHVTPQLEKLYDFSLS